jgi:hypothetical protein
LQNLQYAGNPKQTFSEKKLQDFDSYLPKNISCAQIFWVKNGIVFGSAYGCEQFSPL